MFRRLTSRRTLKWTGMIASILLVGLFVLSAWVYAYSGLRFGRFTARFGIVVGQLWIHVSDSPFPVITSSIGRSDGEIRWWPSDIYDVDANQIPTWQISIPIWVLAAFAGTATTVLLLLGRQTRPLPNHCRKCNYNLTGNTSGRCPECGTPLQRPA